VTRAELEARGGLGPRLGGFGASKPEPDCASLTFSSGDASVAEAMARALWLIASATGRPLRLSDGDGAFIPKKKEFLGLGGYGPII
jgi:hypothetical protein